ncbi:MAG: hypothetical protein H8D46_01355 [FCB group bacterium]|nr:hypothetical protein [FCB group bacterium]
MKKILLAISRMSVSGKLLISLLIFVVGLRFNVILLIFLPAVFFPWNHHKKEDDSNGGN